MDAPKPEVMQQKSPESYKHFLKLQELNQQIDNLGYEELPTGIYERWLQHVNKLKTREYKQKTILLNGHK